MIIVANVREYNFLSPPLEDTVYDGRRKLVYIGRGNRTYRLPRSPLANPYPLMSERNRPALLDAYRQWLTASLDTDAVKDELNRLTEIAREGDLVLLCWCAPKACHGDVIKEAIERRLADDVVRL